MQYIGISPNIFPNLIVKQLQKIKTYFLFLEKSMGERLKIYQFIISNRNHCKMNQFMTYTVHMTHVYIFSENIEVFCFH